MPYAKKEDKAKQMRDYRKRKKLIKVTGKLKKPMRKLLCITISTVEVSENGFRYSIDSKYSEWEIE